MSTSKSSPTADIDVFPLLGYAASYWHIHFNPLPFEEQRICTPLVLKFMCSTQASTGTHLERDAQLRALASACDLGLVHTVEELLRVGADPNYKDEFHEPLLQKVILSGDDDQSVVQEGDNRSDEKSRVAIVKMLLKYGAAVNSSNDDHQTPFHLAAWSGSTEMVDLLVQKGAKIDESNIFGETALHYTAGDRSGLMMNHLIQIGAFVNVLSKGGKTPLD